MLDRRLVRGALCLILVAAGASAARAEVRLRLQPPQGWHLVNKAGAKGQAVIEYAPAGESARDWTDLMSVHILAGAIPLDRYIAVQQALWQGTCGKLKVQGPQLSKDPSGYQVAEYRFACRDPDPAKAPPGVTLRDREYLQSKVFVANGRIYDVQRAYHQDEGSTPMQELETRLDRRLDDWDAFFKDVRLCDTKTEPHC